MKYSAYVVTQCTYEVNIEANSEEEAKSIVEKIYYNGELTDYDEEILNTGAFSEDECYEL